MAKPYNFLTAHGADVFVSSINTLSSRTNIAGFAANAVEGEVGFFNADTNAQVSAAALVIGTKYYIASIQDGKIRKSVPFIAAANQCNEVAYVAPVRPVKAIGFNGTTGSLNNPTLAAGQQYSIKVIRTELGAEPAVERYTYSQRVIASDTAQDVMARIVKDINNPNTATNPKPPIVSATLRLNATFTTAVTVGSGDIVFTNGSTTVTATGHNIVAGEYLGIRPGTTVTGTTTAPVYKVASTSTNAFELDTPYQGATATIANADIADDIEKASAITGVGIVLTAKEDHVDFTTAAEFTIESATQSIMTNFNNGRGTGAQVVELEKQGFIFIGDNAGTTMYAQDMGRPTGQAVSTYVYNTYVFSIVNSKTDIGANALATQNYKIILCAKREAVGTDGAFVDDVQLIIANID